MSERAMRRNAADPRQVKHGRRREEREAERWRGIVRAVMGTPEGREFVGGIIRRAGVFRSIWSPNSEIHYRAGRQDFGHELMAMVIEADESAYLLMEQEYRAQLRAQAREDDAARTPSAGEAIRDTEEDASHG